MQIQNNLGADIIMAFDVCVPYPCEYQPARDAVYQTIRWLERCKAAHTNTDAQSLFGIVQGSVYPDLRALSAQMTSEIDLPGYAIGGVSVGEGHDLMMQVVEVTEPLMPVNKPRYLMGVGYPEDLVEAVWRGVDMFDCVMPTRHARNAQLFTWAGRMNIRRAEHRDDLRPIDDRCECECCTTTSRAYLRHLHRQNDPLYGRLATIHNLFFYAQLIAVLREGLRTGTFDAVLAAIAPMLETYAPR